MTTTSWVDYGVFCSAIICIFGPMSPVSWNLTRQALERARLCLMMLLSLVFATSCVSPTATFAGHSLRRGAKADALDGGIAWELVKGLKAMGRWKSDAFWSHYVSPSQALLSSFASLGVQTPLLAASLG